VACAAPRAGGPPVNAPDFSVVVPTYRRPAALAACLEALATLDYPADRFEVVVVDDGSPEPASGVAAPFAARLPLQMLRQPNQGPAAARNAGAQAAHGRWLAFTDDDCRPAPGWLAALRQVFSAAPDALVGGRTVNVLTTNPYAVASQQLIDFLYGWYNRAERTDWFFASNNLALPREAFLAAGGFDTRFPQAAGEDRELCDRWAHLGHPFRSAPDAIVNHAHTMSLGGFVRQHTTYGRAAFHFHRVRQARGQGRLTPEPLAFYRGLLGHPFQHRQAGAALVGAGLVALSQVANTAGYFLEAARGARSREKPGASD
jgi:glycosyltransferase involved in cell wall biosynthesis